MYEAMEGRMVDATDDLVPIGEGLNPVMYLTCGLGDSSNDLNQHNLCRLKVGL